MRRHRTHLALHLRGLDATAPFYRDCCTLSVVHDRRRRRRRWYGSYPVGYHCGRRDPDGNRVELSCGQPLEAGLADQAWGTVGTTE